MLIYPEKDWRNYMKMNEEIPKWVYIVAASLFLFTILCFGVMIAGMIYI